MKIDKKRKQVMIKFLNTVKMRIKALSPEEQKEMMNNLVQYMKGES